MVDFKSLSGVAVSRTRAAEFVEFKTDGPFSEWRTRQRIIEAPGPRSSGEGVSYLGDWIPFPVNEMPIACQFASRLQEERATVPADSIAGEIASGRGGRRIATVFVAEYFDGGDMDAADKAAAFGVPKDVWDEIFNSALDAGAGE